MNAIIWKFGLVVPVLFLLIFPARAQLSDADTARWTFDIQSNISLTLGNVERFIWMSSAEVKHVKPKWGFASDNRYIYGTIFKRKTESDILSRNFIYLNPKSRFYPYQMTWVERNFRRDVDYRYQIGLGVTRILARNQAFLVKASLTGTFEQTDFGSADLTNEPEGQSEDQIKTARATGRLFAYVKLAHNLFLKFETYAQPSVLDLNNYRIHFNGKISVPVGLFLQLNTQWLYNYESVIVRGNKNADLIWTFGLTYRAVSID